MTSETRRKNQPVLFRLSGVGLAWYTIPLPTVSFIVCVVLSVMYNFKESTATHCKVPNYLPSISAAIGGFTPQRYIWRICIALHVAPRFLVAIVYFNHFKSCRVKTLPNLFYFLAGVSSFLHFLENMALVTLSYISSTENYSMHESSFILFMVFSMMYMLLSIIIFKWSRAGAPLSQRDRWSMKYKISLFLFNLCSFGSAVYFFFRHNKYCEPGVYTLFAFAEYCTVLSNIAFHGAGAIDFGQGNLIFVMDSKDSEHKKQS